MNTSTNSNIGRHKEASTSIPDLARKVNIYYILSALNAIGYIVYVRNFTLILDLVFGSEQSSHAIRNWVSGHVELILTIWILIVGALLDIPGGIYADKRGADRGIRLGMALYLLGAVLYVVSLLLPHHVQFWQSEAWRVLVLIFIGEAALCGAAALLGASLNSWLKKWFNYYKKPNEDFAFFTSRRRLLMNLAYLCFGLPFLYKNKEGNILGAFILDVIVCIACVGISLRLVNLPPKEVEHVSQQQVKSTPEKVNSDISPILDATSWGSLAAGALREIMHNRHLKMLLLVFAPAYLNGFLFLYFWTNISDHFGASADEQKQQPIIAFGWLIIIACRIAGAAIATHTSTPGDRNGVTIEEQKRRDADRLLNLLKVIRIGMMISGLALLFVGLGGLPHPPAFSFLWTPPIIVLVFACMMLGQETYFPLILGRLHNEINTIERERYRATIETMMGVSPALLFVGLYIVYHFLNHGVVAPKNTAVQLLLLTFVVSGGVLVLIAVFFQRLWDTRPAE